MRLEEEFSEAEVKADIHRMSELLANDWTGIEDDGSMNMKADVVKLFQSPTTTLKSDKLSEMRVRIYGNTAVVTVLDTADFNVHGKDAGGVFRLTDVWVKRDGKWQIVASHSSRVK
jgi:ketosteroid isomerase-like protein